MKKWLGVVAVGALLVSCGTKLPQQSTYDLENAYGVVQSAAVAYTKLPYCVSGGTPVCKKPAVVIKLAAYDKNARDALNALETYVRNPANTNSVTITSLMNAASASLQVMTAYESVQGIK